MAKPETQRTRYRLSDFARCLRGEWTRCELPTNGTAIIAVSGGADSVGLLLAVDELIEAQKLDVKVVVAHLDHRLRASSQADARLVRAMARRLGYPCSIGRTDVARRAKTKQDNLEQTARVARYEFLANVAARKRAQLVLTGHTLDDQAETILLNLLRGTGAEGLAGMGPVRPLFEESDILLARPLLRWARRDETEGYCRTRHEQFLTDEMNADERFARVRVRRQLLPLMETFNPRIVEGLGRIAELTREENVALERKAGEIIKASTLVNGKRDSHKRLSVRPLSAHDPALRRRALRQWIKTCRGDLRRLERVHVLAVESLLFGERGGRVIELPGGATVARRRDLLEYSE